MSASASAIVAIATHKDVELEHTPFETSPCQAYIDPPCPDILTRCLSIFIASL